MEAKTPELHILRQAVKDETEETSLTALRKKMPPCPICGKKAFLFHDIVDGFDFGYSGGCPSFCLNDGVHGISESYDPEAPKVDGYSAKEAFDKWIAYCARKAVKSDESQ